MCVERAGEEDIRAGDGSFAVGCYRDGDGALAGIQGEVGVVVLLSDGAGQVIEERGDVLEVGKDEVARDDDAVAAPAFERLQFGIYFGGAEGGFVFGHGGLLLVEMVRWLKCGGGGRR